MSYKERVKAERKLVQEYLEKNLNPKVQKKKSKKKKRKAFNKTVEKRIDNKIFNPTNRENISDEVIEDMKIVIRTEFRERYNREPNERELELGLRKILEMLSK